MPMQLIALQDPPPAGTLTLANTEDVLTRAAEITTAPVVVLHFPKWTDGRAYSQAVLLRGRLGYAGDVRATGDVTVDMLPLLRRCGFSSVQLREGQNAETARRILATLPAPFPGHYQADATGAQPAFA